MSALLALYNEQQRALIRLESARITTTRPGIEAAEEAYGKADERLRLALKAADASDGYSGPDHAEAIDALMEEADKARVPYNHALRMISKLWQVLTPKQRHDFLEGRK